MYKKFNTSHRKPTLILLNSPSSNFTYRAAQICNILAPKLGIFDYSVNINATKNILKKALLKRQHIEGTIDWTSEDYNITKVVV